MNENDSEEGPSMPHPNVDRYEEVIRYLRANPRATNSQAGRACNVHPRTVRRHITRAVEEGVIEKFRMRATPREIGKGSREIVFADQHQDKEPV